MYNLGKTWPIILALLLPNVAWAVFTFSSTPSSSQSTSYTSSYPSSSETDNSNLPGSTIITPSTPQNMGNCPKLTITSQLVTPEEQPINLGSIDVNSQCIDDSSMGGLAWAATAFSGAFIPDCQGNHPDNPYLTGFKEVWGGGIYFAGGASISVRCCPPPQPNMQMKYGSYTDGSSTWVQGTSCDTP